MALRMLILREEWCNMLSLGQGLDLQRRRLKEQYAWQMEN